MNNKTRLGLVALLIPISLHTGVNLSREFKDSETEIRYNCINVHYFGYCEASLLCNYEVNFEGKNVYSGKKKSRHPSSYGVCI